MLLATQPPEYIMQTYFYYLRLNVKTFFTLLQILQSELERISEGEDVCESGKAPHLSDKITAVARRVLPGLRLYSTWFTRYWHVLNANVANTLTNVEVQELWKAYAGTLTLLASSFPAGQLPAEQYMLEEDADTVGFQPLTSPETMKLWYNDSTLKPKYSEVKRIHPNDEMLMRVRDILVDGLHLTQNAEAPLDLDGLRFFYREAGIPSELLASPNNRPDGSPVISAEVMDYPLFPQETPLPEDQKSYSVVAPSESTSTVIAKDSAMNRMVDDLVGPDEGLDPLPEEDENIPPTPPAQALEDATLFQENMYGVASLSIHDLVNSVQNYKKTAGSPATPLYATPMNRVASSSSIRQPANLPSLPDGHHNNGASIWNRHYSGTPDPSSPLLNNGNDVRGSPLLGTRASGLFGHARGNSSNSLHSNDWSYPIATPPVQRTVPGAAWGNPNTSAQESMYTNSNGMGYSHYYTGNTTDMNLASPLLFGKGTWNSDFEGGHNSFGRTPPNGQGG
jgi:hypothetical protein